MKIVYNLTVKISKEIDTSFISELRNKILPELTDGKIIESTQINKLLLAEAENENTYALQFLFKSSALFEEFRLRKMESCLTALDQKFRGQYVYFATAMELIHYYNNTDTA